MIKRLKSIEQILDEHKHIGQNPYYKSHKDEDTFVFYPNMEKFIIARLMEPFFGMKIKVEKVDGSTYEWIGVGNCWYFKDDWFESDIELLEDSLFEI